MRELEAISDLAGRAGSYAALRFAVDTADPERGALLQRVQERAARIADARCCSSSSSGTSSTTSAPRSCSPPTSSTSAATTCAPRAATARTCSPSPRSGSSPRPSVTGRRRSSRLFTEQTSAITVELPDADEPRAADGRALPAALARTASAAPRPPRRSPRRSSPACAPAPSSSTRCCQDKATERPAALATEHWLAARNLANEASDESVAGADRGGRAAATSSPRRWYRLKAQLLGLDRLADYDRMAPVADDERAVA